MVRQDKVERNKTSLLFCPDDACSEPCYNDGMTLGDLIQHTYHLALIEVVDLDYYRLFYGRTENIWNETPLDKDVEIQSINPFEAETEAGVFEPAIQIVVTSRLVQNIR